MDLKKFILLTICFLAAFASCKPEQKEEAAKIVTTNFSVPSIIEVEEGQSVVIPLRGTTNMVATDQVMLRTVAGEDIPCKVLELKDGSRLTIELPEDLVSGYYKMYIKRGSTNYYVAAFDLTVIKSLSIEPDKDTTIYGLVQCEGKGVPNVLVSDGTEIVKTNADGIYQIPSLKKWKYVFVIIPSGYEVPAQGILPELSAALTQAENVPERKDFELIKSDNDNFTMFVLGDMHLANRNNDISQFSAVANTLNQSIAKAPGKRYCITLGDMTWDVYWYSNKFTFPEYLSTANEHFKDITFFHTMGNHDNDMNSVGDYEKSFRYTRDIAPLFYSFNLGKIHFIVMDNIDYNNVGANNDGTGNDYRSQYVLDYTADQMTWLQKDLSFVDKSTPVFITSHAPLSVPSGATSFNDKYMNGADSAGEANMSDFINAVKDYNVHFLSGHTHKLFHRTHNSKFSEHNEAAICATWWWSGKQTPGIHVGQEGTPGGFGVWEFTGKNFKFSYQSAGHDENYQFRAYDMNEVKKVVTLDAAGGNKNFSTFVNAIAAYPANSILVNVWDYDKDWTVSISENGKELTVTKDYAYDPLHLMAWTAPRSKSVSEPNFTTGKWCHFFKATASSATSTVVVKVTDRNGKVFTETMTRPKAFNMNDYKNK
ncbi:MAG: calcineurin-like phosphoesterase C-terminal domain-containing protein [Bacteroidales bacterium]|nr:calcineurin-like phosphoesterase C-terminal domain-containing protein [Bacteroidales bacterium]